MLRMASRLRKFARAEGLKLAPLMLSDFMVGDYNGALSFIRRSPFAMMRDPATSISAGLVTIGQPMTDSALTAEIVSSGDHAGIQGDQRINQESSIWTLGSSWRELFFSEFLWSRGWRGSALLGWYG